MRELVDGQRLLERIEYVTTCLLSGYETVWDPVTHVSEMRPLDGQRVAALGKVLDAQFRMLSKVLPDLKAIELHGDGLGISVNRDPGDRMVLATKLLAIMRDQESSTEQPGWLN